MAAPIADVQGTVMQSIAQITIYVDVTLQQDDWQVVVQFEDALYDTNTGEVAPNSGQRTMIVRRQWAQIKNDPDVVALHTAIKDKCYQWRQEDLVNPPGAKGAPLPL